MENRRLHALIAEALRRAPLNPEEQAEAVLATFRLAHLTVEGGGEAGPASPVETLGEEDWQAIWAAEAELVRGHGVAWSAIRSKYPP